MAWWCMLTKLDSSSSSVMIPILARKAGTVPVNCIKAGHCQSNFDQIMVTGDLNEKLVSARLELKPSSVTVT